jgi:hypothetical protein
MEEIEVMEMREISGRIVTFVTILLCAELAVAQFGADEYQQDMWSKPKGNVETIQAKGKIRAMQGEVIQVANEELKQQWLVKMPREPAGIRVSGTARPTYLQPGMMVRFSGQFDSKGNSHAPIEKLEVFTPKPVKEGMLPDQQQFGIFPEAVFGAKMLEDATASGQPKTEIAPFVVSGQLRGFRKGELFVAAGAALVRASLAEKAEIFVDVPDYRWVRVGDEIEVNGWSYPHLMTHVVATRVSIKASQPFGEIPEEKPGKLPATSAGKRSGPGAKTDDEELPF